MKPFAIAFLATAASAGLAQAADMPAYAPAEAAVLAHDWSGFYIGAQVGYAFGDTSATGEFDQGLPLTELDYDVDGFFGGGTLGYNMQFDSVVLGLELEGGYLDASGDITGGPFGDDFSETQYGAYGVVAGRAGFAWDSVLAYAKGGLAVAEIDNFAADLDGGLPDLTDAVSVDDVSIGFAVGAGVELALSESWSAKVEYLYMDFEDQSGGSLDTDPETEFENNLHTVKAGVNYNF